MLSECVKVLRKRPNDNKPWDDQCLLLMVYEDCTFVHFSMRQAEKPPPIDWYRIWNQVSRNTSRLLIRRHNDWLKSTKFVLQTTVTILIGRANLKQCLQIISEGMELWRSCALNKRFRLYHRWAEKRREKINGGRHKNEWDGQKRRNPGSKSSLRAVLNRQSRNTHRRHGEYP